MSPFVVATSTTAATECSRRWRTTAILRLGERGAGDGGAQTPCLAELKLADAPSRGRMLSTSSSTLGEGRIREEQFYSGQAALSYRLSGGRLQGWIDATYHGPSLGQKQIFATSQCGRCLRRRGRRSWVDDVQELSFPYSFYLKKLLGSDAVVRLSLPIVKALLAVFPVRNKLLVIGLKSSRLT